MSVKELQYDIEKWKFSKLKGKIEIPPFQRGLVWSDPKKEEFIKTLKEGLPIGVLLISKKVEEEDKYLVIDGLQRYTTMLEYSNKPFKYISRDEIKEKDIINLIYECPVAMDTYDKFTDDNKKILIEDIRTIIVDAIKEGKKIDNHRLSVEISESICEKRAEFSNDEMLKISNCVYDILEDFKDNSNIDDVVIPLILFTGSQDKLASVFQKLNDEGVKLTKYDIFAATWVDSIITVKDDPDFIEYIIEKYNYVQEQSDVEVSNYDPDGLKESGELTVFEYAFCLGKAISSSCKVLFGKKNKDKDKIESIGFLILAEIFGLEYSEMAKLAETMTEYEDVIDFKELKDIIVETSQLIEKALNKDNYLIAPTDNKTSLACHSELQLASMILTAFKLTYKISLENGIQKVTGNKNEMKTFKKYLFRHYLYDILREYWSGSGDTKLERIIEHPETCEYILDIDKKGFEQALANWMNESNGKSTSKNIAKDAKLFYNYFLRLAVSVGDDEKFDMEHCVPQKVLEKYFIDRGINVPISAASNLVYIPLYDNRKKGERTYYQDQDLSPDTYVLDEDKLDEYGYPKRSEIKFAESVETLTEDNYRKFLKDRINTVVAKALDMMFDD